MKTEFIQARIPAELKKAIETYCGRNFIDPSSVLRMALANYGPVQKVLEELIETGEKQ